MPATTLAAARRRLLRAALAGAAFGVAGGARVAIGGGPARDAAAAASGTAATSRWLAAARVGEDEFRAVALDALGRERQARTLPGRAHGAAAHPGRGIGCVFARRPGTWLCTFELRDIGASRFVEPTPGRRFSGHGAYSRDGTLLYTSESDIDRQRGVVGVRDVANGYRHVAEFPTHGIGPHEILRPHDTDLLVVANGGIATHPDEGDGRTPLNLGTMSPSIVVLDARDGALLSRHALPPEQHRVSLRHLAVDADRRVWFAGQHAHEEDASWRADAAAPPLPLAGSFALVGRHGRPPSPARTQPLDVLELPHARVPQESAYLSSVAVDARHVVWTSSRDNVAFRVDRRTHALADVVRLEDCSGVAPAPDGAGFILSTGFGETLRWRDGAPESLAHAALAWDNHLATIGG